MSGLRTPRLRLRSWTGADVGAYAAITSDLEVMRHFRRPLTAAEAAVQVERFRAHEAAYGFTQWVAADRRTGTLLGRIGLLHQPDFTPEPGAVEVGWMLARDHWGAGLATEGATACLRFAFERLGLPRVISLTTPANLRSLAVMRRLGMEPAGRTRWRGQPHLWCAVEAQADPG